MKKNSSNNKNISISSIIKEAADSFYKKDYLHALSLYYSILALDLNDSVNYHNVGLTYDMLGEYELAVSFYKKAIRLNPSDIRSVNNLAHFYYTVMKDENFTKYYLDYAIKVNPNDAEAYNTYGLLHSAKKEFDLAIAYFKKSIKYDKNYFKNYYDLAVVYNEIEKKDEAIQNLEQALKLNKLFTQAKDLLQKLKN